MSDRLFVAVVVAVAFVGCVWAMVAAIRAQARETTAQVAALLGELRRQHEATLEHLQRTAVVGGTPREFAERKMRLDEAIHGVAIQEKEIALEQARRDAEVRDFERVAKREVLTARVRNGLAAGLPINPMGG